MKKKTNKIYMLIICLFLLFGIGEWLDRKDEQVRDCVIRTTNNLSLSYDSALEYCENLDQE